MRDVEEISRLVISAACTKSGFRSQQQFWVGFASGRTEMPYDFIGTVAIGVIKNPGHHLRRCRIKRRRNTATTSCLSHRVIHHHTVRRAIAAIKENITNTSLTFLEKSAHLGACAATISQSPVSRWNSESQQPFLDKDRAMRMATGEEEKFSFHSSTQKYAQPGRHRQV